MNLSRAHCEAQGANKAIMGMHRKRFALALVMAFVLATLFDIVLSGFSWAPTSGSGINFRPSGSWYNVAL
ncbi:hypothetical protein HRbin10_02109 [bacterium HR10]|nr:hypothetical protein HRbin10_02109 [bacterium HR10]